MTECVSLEPTLGDLERIFRFKFGDLGAAGWGPRMRWRFKYFTPDEHYETVVAKLVTEGTIWLDVGCGRNIFPNNRKLTRDLAERCGLLIGVDSDDTIDENAFVHQRFKTRIEDFRSDKLFDLVTFRMVAEHITNPQQVIESLVKLTKPGGKVVIYTVNRWSPVPLITWMVPFRFHHSVKELLWGTERKDTFPVAYRMNTRGELVRLFEAENFRECYFGYLDDCRSLARFRVTLFLELCAWKFARSLGFRYPETCLLGVYERHH